MEGEFNEAEPKGKGESYPLTISRTAKKQVPLPIPSKSPVPPPSSKTRDLPEDHVTEKEGSSVNRSRFYFESDTLALKNNPE